MASTSVEVNVRLVGVRRLMALVWSLRLVALVCPRLIGRGWRIEVRTVEQRGGNLTFRPYLVRDRGAKGASR